MAADDLLDEGPQDEREDEALPVEAPPEQPGDALRAALRPRLSAERSAELARRILLEYQADLDDRQEWEQRLVEWDDAYYNKTADKTFPWEGAANFHVPLTMMGVETYKPRLVESVLGQNPPVVAIPMTAGSERTKDIAEAVLNWQITTRLDIAATVNLAAHLFLQPGLVVAKTYWKSERVRRKYLREFPATQRLREDIFPALFGDTPPTDVESIGELHWRMTVPVPGESVAPLECELRMALLEDEAGQQLIQVLVEQEEVVQGPAIDLLDPVDLIVPVKGGSDLEALPHKMHRLWMSEDELRAKAALGRFEADVVERLLTARAPTGDAPPMDAAALRESRDQTEGVEGEGASSVRAEQYAILEVYRREDLDEDGREEEIIVWVSVDLDDAVLGWDYRDNVYAHGRCPLRAARFLPIPFRFYGLPFAEVVRGIQDEINTIHNQRVDYGTLQNLPWGFKRASMTLPPISQRLRPGEFLDVDNPQQDIVIPKWQGTPAWGEYEEALLMQYYERLARLTDLNLGRQPTRVGATRTNAGTQTLLGESGLGQKEVIRAFQTFWAGIFSDILALDQQYLPPRSEFRLTGKRPTVIQIKDRSQIRGQFDLRLATGLELNRQQLRDDATVILQATLNPALIQGGIVGRKGVRQAMADFYRAFGKDPDFFLEDQQVPMAPEAELLLMLAGEDVSPTPGEDVAHHLAMHQAALFDPAVTPEVRGRLMRHIAMTQQLAQTMQMAQAMQSGGPNGRPPVGPQAVNAQQGRAPQPAQPTAAGAPGPVQPAMMGPGGSRG